MKNWAGNYEFRASRIIEPATLDELRDVVRRESNLHVLGSRHSFNDIADSDGALVSLARLPERFDVDPKLRTVTVGGSARYGDICQRLDEAGFALHNLASLPHISIAGAVATGTHGSGDRLGNLSTAVVGLDLMTPDGDMRRLSRPGRDFDGCVVSLGALGIVTAVTLAVEPRYDVSQTVFEDLELDEFALHFDEITALGDSISFFLGYLGPGIDQVWIKRRRIATAPGEALDSAPAHVFDALPATGERHPIRGLTADACTQQMGVGGPWYQRWPHFRLDHTPSAGDELQSEYFVDRRHAVQAFHVVWAMRDRIAPLLQVSEMRTIAADELWLSPAYGRDSVSLHFTWRPDETGVRRVLPEIDAALAPFEPRPHWGKLFTMAPSVIRAGYPRFGDFAALVDSYDPGHKFRNAYLARLFG